MPSTTGHGVYDHTLLAEAPALDKRRLQEGYTTDGLLEQPPVPKPMPVPPSDPELAALQPKVEQSTLPEKPVPFWRTQKGRIVMLVGAVVVVAVIVGGAVGGTAGKKKKGANSASNEAQGAEQPANDNHDPKTSVNPLNSILTGLAPPKSTGVASPDQSVSGPITPPGGVEPGTGGNNGNNGDVGGGNNGGNNGGGTNGNTGRGRRRNVRRAAFPEPSAFLQ